MTAYASASTVRPRSWRRLRLAAATLLTAVVLVIPGCVTGFMDSAKSANEGKLYGAVQENWKAINGRPSKAWWADNKALAFVDLYATAWFDTFFFFYAATIAALKGPEGVEEAIEGVQGETTISAGKTVVTNTVTDTRHPGPRISIKTRTGDRLELQRAGAGGFVITEKTGEDGKKRTVIRRGDENRSLTCKDYSNAFKYKAGRRYSVSVTTRSRFEPLPVGGMPIICTGCPGPRCSLRSSGLWGFDAAKHLQHSCGVGCKQDAKNHQTALHKLAESKQAFEAKDPGTSVTRMAEAQAAAKGEEGPDPAKVLLKAGKITIAFFTSATWADFFARVSLILAED